MPSSIPGLRHLDSNASWIVLVLSCVLGCSLQPRSGQDDVPAAGSKTDAGTRNDLDGVDNIDIGPGGSGNPSYSPRPGPVHLEFVLGDLSDSIGETFAGASQSASDQLELVYPSPGTMLPPNTERLLLQWNGGNYDRFKVSLNSPRSALVLYTDGKEDVCAEASATARCLQLTAETLQPFAAAVAGETVVLTFEALTQAEPTKTFISPKYNIHFGPEDVAGAIYYWSTSKEGIRRTTLNQEEPFSYVVKDYKSSSAPDGACVACHTLSRSGEKMAFAFPGDLLGIIDVSETLPPPLRFGPTDFPSAEVKLNVSASWSAFGPDDKHLLVAGQGGLQIVSASTGKLVSTPSLPTDSHATMPDWSPDGTQIAFSLHKNPSEAQRVRHISDSSIFIMNGEETNFANSTALLTSKKPGETYAYPMYSHDGKWLALSHADFSSEEDSTSRILLVRAEEGSSALELTLANTQVGTSSMEGLMNNMPTWAPTSNPHVLWIAFSSRRPYGFLSQDEPTKQLWIFAVDVRKIGTSDPSFPAFRLPGQQLDENNHRPFWAVDVLPPTWKPPLVR